MERVGDLEIAHDPEWQRRSWIVQRVGWVLLAAFLLAAVLGLFGGDGPLREAEAGESTIVRYDRFTRFGSPTELSVRPPSEAIDRGQVEIAIDAEYLASVTVDSISPQPDQERAVEDAIVYTFLVGTPPQPIDFQVTPREAGVQSATVRAGTQPTVEFSQIVYP